MLVLVSCPLYLASDFNAHIAQSVEHFLGKEEVIGSIPIVGSSIECISFYFVNY